MAIKKEHDHHHIEETYSVHAPRIETIEAVAEAMKQLGDFYQFSEDFAKGNLHYLLAEGYYHEYPAVYQYVYNYLPYLFGGLNEE